MRDVSITGVGTTEFGTGSSATSSPGRNGPADSFCTEIDARTCADHRAGSGTTAADVAEATATTWWHGARRNDPQ